GPSVRRTPIRWTFISKAWLGSTRGQPPTTWREHAASSNGPWRLIQKVSKRWWAWRILTEGFLPRMTSLRDSLRPKQPQPELCPCDANAFRWLHCVGVAKLMLGADPEAAAWLRKSLEANRNYPLVHFHLGAALVFLQQPDEARAAIQEGLTLDPTFTIRRMRRL